jgi:hypothetical protein
VVGVEADIAAVRDARHNLRPWPWARVRKGDVAAVLRRAVRPGAEGPGAESKRAEGPGAESKGAEGPGVKGHRAAEPGTPGPGVKGGPLPAARLVVADPPRSGLAREVIDYLGATEGSAARFAYVSCDPATLARDIGLLVARGWVLTNLRAFDAFPMTHHVECVATLVTDAA